MTHSAKYTISTSGISMTIHFEASSEALFRLGQSSELSSGIEQYARLIHAAASGTFDQCAKLQEQFFQNLQVSLCQLISDDISCIKSNIKMKD